MAARLLPFRYGRPAFNMAVDQALLLTAEEPVLRFYGWDPPAISLGCFQKQDGDLAELRAHGLPLVRRITGGGAIVHWHELTYSLVLPLTHPVLEGASTRESYARLHGPILRCLRRHGIEALQRDQANDPPGPSPRLCFDRATSLDVVVNGKKLVGSAQRRTRDRVLQHGSILLIENALQKGTASLAALMDRPPSAEELSVSAACEFEDLLGPLHNSTLQRTELDLASSLESTFAIA